MGLHEFRQALVQVLISLIVALGILHNEASLAKLHGFACSVHKRTFITTRSKAEIMSYSFPSILDLLPFGAEMPAEEGRGAADHRVSLYQAGRFEEPRSDRRLRPEEALSAATR